MYYGQEKNFTPHLVHRLDKHTSGILIIAKNTQSARELGDIIAGRSIKKEYIALCKGQLSKEGKIDIPLENKKALTTFITQKVYKTHLGEFSLLNVNIKTGRKHQIRKHLSLINHPIIGDDVYGDKKLNREFKREYGLKRYFLHCHSMEFYFKNKHIAATAPLSEDLKNVLKNLEKGE